MTRSMARTKHTEHRANPAGATTEVLKAKAKAVAKALAPKKETKKEAKEHTKAAGKKASKAIPEAQTKVAPEVRGLGRAERCAQREKARRSLEKVGLQFEKEVADARDGSAEVRTDLGLDKGKGEAKETDKFRVEASQFASDVVRGLMWRKEAKKARQALESEKSAKGEGGAKAAEAEEKAEGEMSFMDALILPGSAGDGARQVLTKLVMAPWDSIVGCGVRNGTPEGSPAPEQQAVPDTAEYYKAQEQKKGKEAALHESYPSTEPEVEEEEDAVVAGESGEGGAGKSSGECGGHVRVGRVVARELRLAEYVLGMRVVTRGEARWRFMRWVGTVVGVRCGLDGQEVCVQVDGELYENELASGVFEKKVGRLVVPCRSTEGTGRDGTFSMETYWKAHELREVTGDTGVGSVLV